MSGDASVQISAHFTVIGNFSDLWSQLSINSRILSHLTIWVNLGFLVQSEIQPCLKPSLCNHQFHSVGCQWQATVRFRLGFFFIVDVKRQIWLTMKSTWQLKLFLFAKHSTIRTYTKHGPGSMDHPVDPVHEPSPWTTPWTTQEVRVLTKTQTRIYCLRPWGFVS